MDVITTESVKWADVKSFDDILRSQNLDTPQNEVKLMSFIEAHFARTRGSQINNPTETNLPEALDQGKSQLEPWSAKIHHIIQSLMRGLEFSELHHRQESIHDHFEGTFQWVYEPPQDADRPWDSFATWLTEGRSIYWITGKAGSGKSTLMRMLHESERTLDLLKTWCSGVPLVTASFFFWNSGSDIQMSQDGLLRSVLLQIIEQRLRQNNCEILKEKLVVFAMMQKSIQTFHFKDLLQLFRFVIEDAEVSIKFFLLLDGLDEFDGDKSKLVSLIHTLGKYEHVKVCVSSRPWTVFEDGFRQQPSLMLQHLTHNDILMYTRETLRKEPAFRELSWGDPSNASELIRSITRKASGVFLWVVLTVDSLIKGLTEGDRVKDLEARLDEIPEELEDLFRKMLHGLKGRYFQDAARIFQIHRARRWRGFGGQAGARLPLLVYAFADEHGADLDGTVKWPPKGLTAKECFMISISTKRRINSRCNGLLEIEEPYVNTRETWSTRNKQLDSLISEAEAGNPNAFPMLDSLGHSLARVSVQYLHRTVKDYLETSAIRRSIESSAPTEGEHYWVLSLCLGYIMLWRNSVDAQLKLRSGSSPAPPGASAFPPGCPSIDSSTDTTADMELFEPTLFVAECGEESRRMLENCLEHASGFLPSSLKTHMRLLDALGAALFDDGAANMEFNQPKTLRTVIWEYKRRGFIFEDFLSLAVHCNLFEYVAAKISCLAPEERTATASRLLVIAALKRGQLLKKPRHSQTDKPGRVTESPSLKQASESLETAERDWSLLDQEEAAPSFHMMQVLMRHGADPDVPAFGISSRRIIDMRRWELVNSTNFQKIVESLDSAKYDSLPSLGWKLNP